MPSILTDIHNSFYDFDLDGTLPFIENDKGVALRTPSTLKPHKFNYSRVELYAVDDELRLSSTEEYHFREFPTLSIIYGDKVEKYVFVEAYDLVDFITHGFCSIHSGPFTAFSVYEKFGVASVECLGCVWGKASRNLSERASFICFRSLGYQVVQSYRVIPDYIPDI